MPKFRLTREDCEDLGFAVSCAALRVVSMTEFKDWVIHVITEESIDDLPSYFYNLTDLHGPFFASRALMDVVGFYPSWDSSDDERDALYGVAYRRSKHYRSDAISRADALSALMRNPHIMDRFRRAFPFLEISDAD